MRPLLVPVERACAVAVLLVLQQAPVRKRVPVARDGDDHLARLLLVGVVEAGEPVARVFVLALRPDLHRLVRVALVRADEVEPDARRRPVGDRDPELVAPASARRRGRRGSAPRRSRRSPALPATVTDVDRHLARRRSRRGRVPSFSGATVWVAVPETPRAGRSSLRSSLRVVDVDDAVARPDLAVAGKGVGGLTARVGEGRVRRRCTPRRGSGQAWSGVYRATTGAGIARS